MQLNLVFSGLINGFQRQILKNQNKDKREASFLPTPSIYGVTLTWQLGAHQLQLYSGDSSFVRANYKIYPKFISFPIKFSVDSNQVQYKAILITYLFTICLALSWSRLMQLWCS